MNTLRDLVYGYCIVRDEEDKGEFSVQVIDLDGGIVMELDSNYDEIIIQDDVVYYGGDINGLTQYAIAEGIIPAEASIHRSKAFGFLSGKWAEFIEEIDNCAFDHPNERLYQLYEDNEKLSEALNFVIHGFIYSDYSHKTIIDIKNDLDGIPTNPKKSSSLGMR